LSGQNEGIILSLLSKDRIKHILKRIDPEQRLDADVEDV
jgi:hypothetical protein